VSAASVLVLGASSDIGAAVARRFAAGGHPLMLAARDPGRLAATAEDLRIRHRVAVTVHGFDAVCVVGLLGDQAASAADPAGAAVTVMRSNYEGPAAILGLLANRFEARGSGTLVGVSSVAGDRGRASNYVYGSAKAGLTAYLSGLRNRLARRGVHVVTVKPGFVDTRMTAGMDLPKALTASPEEVARAVHAACARRRDLVYVRRVWWPVMGVIRALPEAVFKKTKL
jgi:short-subunit dehydrogenase